MICYHIRPGDRCDLTRSQADYIFASILCETTKTIKEDEVFACRFNRPVGLDLCCPFWLQERNRRTWSPLAFELLFKCSSTIGEYGTGHSLHQDSGLNRYLVLVYCINSTKLFRVKCTCADGDQTHNFIIKLLPIARTILIPDHQIHGNSHRLPVGMSPQELTGEIDIGPICDPKEDNWEIA